MPAGVFVNDPSILILIIESGGQTQLDLQSELVEETAEVEISPLSHMISIAQ